MSVADQNFVELYRAGSLAQAHAVQFALHEADISVVIVNSNVEQAVGDVPCGWATAPRLMVEESQLVQARQVIHKINPDSGPEASLSLSEVIGLVPMIPFATVFAVADYLVPPPKPVEVEQSCCLACGTELSAVESRCSQCGWTYESEPNSESVNPI